MSPADPTKLIHSEINFQILSPYLDRELERIDPREQTRSLAANQAGPRRCRLLDWLTKRDMERPLRKGELNQLFYHTLLTSILLREDTKRIVVDDLQYAKIINTPYPVPDDIARDLRWPFDDHIYIEIQRGMIGYEYEGNVHVIQGLMVLAGPEPRLSLNVITCTQNNWAGATVGQIDLQKNAYRPLNEDLDRDELQPEEFNPYVRLLAYMTAKGIEIVQHPANRASRRLMTRKGLPNPWHVIDVEPTTVLADEDGDQRGETDRRHSYRYDVAGHIRFGRHRLRDGSHRTTREWIRPHQRGLANSNYVPATRRYSKKLNDEIEKALEEDPETT